MYYLKLYYKLLEWEWYKNANVMRLFIHCLLKANRQTKNWQGITIEAGSFVTSYEHLAEELGITVRQVRTAIDKLKMTNELTHKGHAKYSIITVNNWNDYQINDKHNDKQMTNKRQTNDNQMTTTRECKNDNNDTHTINDENSCVCVLTDSEKKVLRKYAQKSKAYNVDAYIHSLVKTGAYKQIVEEEHKKQQTKNVVQLPKIEKIEEDPAVTEQAFLKFQEKFKQLKRSK